MSMVFTIGYEGTDIDRFTATLKAVDVQMIVDVRAVALSRKKGFSKRGLAGRLQDEGIGYLHLVGLGDPKPGREAARAGRYDEFRRIYGSHLATVEAQAALRDLIQTVQSRSVCLLCFERDPATCHRSIVAGLLKERGLTVVDLYGDSPRRYDHFIHSGRDPRQSVAAA